MSVSRRNWSHLSIHVGVFLAASALAYAAAKKPRTEGNPLEVELWRAQPDAVTAVHYKAAKVEVYLTPKADSRGRYVVGKVTKTIDPPQAAPEPEPNEEGVTPVVAPEPAKAEPTTETNSFVGVKEATELLETVATLRAVRSLGKASDDRLREFGLIESETAELTLEIAGKTRSFTLGGRTPGGGDVYAQDKQSGDVYVLPGDVANDVELAHSRLMERELLTAPEDKEVAKVVVSHGDKSRAIVHSSEYPSFWTDESAPQEKNETLTNWMKKFERLRATEYVEGEPENLELLAVAKFSAPKGEDLGSIELAKQTRAGDDKPRFLARSPQTRWWAVVLSSTASELAADLPSILE